MPTSSPARAELRARPWTAAVGVGIPLLVFSVVAAASVAGPAGAVLLGLATIVGVAVWERARRNVRVVADDAGIHLTDLLGEVVTVPWDDVEHVRVEVPGRASPLASVRIKPRSEDEDVVFSSFRFAGTSAEVAASAAAFRTIVASHTTPQPGATT